MNGNTIVVRGVSDQTLGRDLNSLMTSLSFPHGLRSVGIKLNLCDYRPGSSGATSRVEVVSAMIRALQSGREE